MAEAAHLTPGKDIPSIGETGATGRVHRVFGQLGWVGASQIFTATARFLILVIVARALSPETFGDFAFFVGLALVVSNLTELGLGRTLVRFAGVARGKLNFTEAQEYCSAVFQIKVLLSLVILVPGVCFVLVLRMSHELSLVTWALATGLLGSFGPLIASVFQVQGKFGKYFWAYAIDPVRLGVVLVLLLCGAASINRLVLAYLLSPLLLLALFPSMELNLGKITRPSSSQTYLDLWRFGKWLLLIALIESMWQRLDILMLRWLGGARDVGIYSGAYMFMGVAALVTGSIGTVIYPRMAESHGRRNPVGLASQYVASTNAMAYLGLPCVLGIAAVAHELVNTILGRSYSPAISLFPWLAAYGMLLVLQMNAGGVLFAVGKPEIGFYILFVITVLGVIGNFLLIPAWHAAGAAVVLAACTLVSALLSWIAVARYTGAWPDFKKTGLFLLVGISMYLVVRFLPIPISGIGELGVRVLIGVIVYCGMIRVICGGVYAPIGDLAKTY